MAVVEYKTRLQKPRRGVCSTWLSRLKVAERPVVPLWVKKGTIMFPKEAVTPVIMVGPGKNETFLCLWSVGVSDINHLKEPQKRVFFSLSVKNMNNIYIYNELKVKAFSFIF